MSWELLLAGPARKALKRIPASDQSRILAALKRAGPERFGRSGLGEWGRRASVGNGYPHEGREHTMIQELERVVLTEPVPTEGLESGDVGTVVHAYRDGEAFKVEFTTLEDTRPPS